MSKRDTILDCAESLLLRDGSSGLTLDRVALEARVSKGGLLYHFPTKEDLISALVERTIGIFDREMQCYQKKLGGGPGSATVAYALASLRRPWGRESGFGNHGAEFLAAVLAGLAVKPDLMEPLREASRRWQEVLDNDGIDPMKSTIVQLVVDGLWFRESLGFGDYSQEKQEEILAELKRYCLPAGAEVAIESWELTTREVTT